MNIKIKKGILKIIPILFLIGMPVIFFWKFFFKGLIPFPGDLLVGAYFPWLDYKWGYAVGVPVKNPLISDVYSQIYIWKEMIVNLISSGQWPLWNPTMFSGYPLMANFQSGLFNIFNVLPVLFGMVKGWSLMLWMQIFGSSVAMYFLLKNFKYSLPACLMGAVVYSIGGFPIVWLEYATVGQAMVWLPLIVLSIDKGKFIWLPLLFFFVVGSGHFQALVYSAIVAITYFTYKYWKNFRTKLLPFLFFSCLSISISLVQLLPTMELASFGIRFSENYVREFNYGLAPIQNLITLIAPDYFGNPITNNYWGAFNYENVIYYCGIISLLSLVVALFKWKDLKSEKYFLVLAIFSLLLGFDTFIGRSIYIFKVPGLSTSVAGRIGMIFTFAMAVLSGYLINNLAKIRKATLYKSVAVIFLVLFTSSFLLIISRYLFLSSQYSLTLADSIGKMSVGLRNSVIPWILLVITSLIFVFNKTEVSKWLLLFVTILELFRFGWKYTTFVPEVMTYPSTEIIDFVKNDKNIFPIDRENGEIMPPNTWSAYGLQSPSGYDPMAMMNYVKQYNKDLNGEAIPGFSRYSELRSYDAEALGKYNVKYLLAIKRNEKYEIPGDILSYKIDEKEWNRVFETKSVAVLLNTKYQERARVLDGENNNAKGTAEILSYESNRVVIKFNNIDGEKLLLADTYYPGWVASINGNKTKIGDEIRPFRTVDIRGIKEGEVVFEYKPKSFYIGLLISGISFGIWLGLVIFQAVKKASR